MNDFLVRVLLGVIHMFFGLGFVWMYAWVWNPSLTSNTVTFFGFLYGSLVWWINEAKET